MLVAPFTIGEFGLGQLTMVAILSMLTTSMNVTFGYAGELVLGHVAIYAVGGYAAGILIQHGQPMWIVLVVAGVLAIVVGLLSGLPGLRLGGWALAMTTFFLVFLIPGAVSILSHWTGGLQGLVVGYHGSTKSLFYLVLLVSVAWFVVMRNLLTSQWGYALVSLRQGPVLASSLGISVYRLKLAAHTIGAVPAGLAGVLFALHLRYIGPEIFTASLTIQLVAALVIGGAGSVYGPIGGALIVVVLQQQFSGLAQYSVLVYGAALVVVAVAFPGGSAAKLATLAPRLLGRPLRVDPESRALRIRPMALLSAVASAGQSATLAPAGSDGRSSRSGLTVSRVSKTFDGVVALDEVSVQARPGRVMALVGPNGSGKTTLLNVINGFIRPDSGVVLLREETLSGLGAHHAARAGVARTFQTPRIPDDMSVLGAVAIGVYSQRRWRLWEAALRMPRWRRETTRQASIALDALRRVGLGERAEAKASSLALGEKRLLEIARALVSDRLLILLDEPASGLSEPEIDVFVEALQGLKQSGRIILLVEHNTALVARVADDAVCLATGRVIASGPCADVLALPAVLSAWIGESPASATSNTGHD
jgi:branched-chain amino acid transport system permease protein